MFIKSTPPLIQCEILLQYVMLRVEKLQKGTNENNLVAPAPRSWYIYLQACQFCMITKLKRQTGQTGCGTKKTIDLVPL